MTKKQESKIRSLRKAGKSIKAIAKEMHISDKRISKMLKPVPASNKIVLAKPVAKKVAVKKPVAKPVTKPALGPIDLVWKDGRIVKANRSPAELLVFGHSVITFALGEIVKGIKK